ncbi:glycosyltransferase family 2 protein [Acidocella sp.]|uniref:glycosyltransferase family 2 protein n=1 Tax=Acidocella sp. TaxID=50710 RepID=UPI0026362B40|nr:glycosyltransferase family 2 protein [Acidocella sp.]
MNAETRFLTQSDQEPAAPVVSVVVPVHDEGPNLTPLIEAISAALGGIAHEIVYVDDGSTDDTQKILAGLAAKLPTLVRVRHRKACGQSGAVITGVKTARGRYVATLDGDGQNDPADIPAMLEAMRAAEAEAAGPVLIAGHRVHRQDSQAKRWGSKIANRVRAYLLQDATPDTGCGLKLFRRQAFLELPHFDHIHRFLPALFIRAGGRVVSVPVRHHARAHGASHYNNWQRLKVGIVDLFGVAWLQRRWKVPQIETLE